MAGFIRLNAPSVRAYETTAESQFTAIAKTMDTLADDCNNVKFSGENATAFKQTVGNSVNQMATDIDTALKAYFRAVASATTAVAGSLGGKPLILDPKMPTVSKVSVAGATETDQEIDPDMMSGLQTNVTGHCTKILTITGDHESALQATDWQGQAKTDAGTACKTFTTSVNDAVKSALDRINKYITEQTEASVRADSGA